VPADLLGTAQIVLLNFLKPDILSRWAEQHLVKSKSDKVHSDISPTTYKRSKIQNMASIFEPVAFEAISKCKS